VISILMEPGKQPPLAKCLYCGRTPFGRSKIVHREGQRPVACCVACFDADAADIKRRAEARKGDETRASGKYVKRA